MKVARLSRILIVLVFASSAALADGVKREVNEYLLMAAGEPPPKPKSWAISGTAGAVVTSGNTDDTTLNLQLKIEHDFNPDLKLTIRTFSIFSKTGGTETANEHILSERLQKELNKKEAIWQQLLLEYDSAEQLSLRAILTAGYRRKLVDKKNFVLHGDIGGGIMYESFFGGNDDTTPVAQVGFEFNWQMTKALRYRQVLVFFPSLSDLGEFRMYWLSEFTVPISKTVSGKLTILDQYNSDPQVGVENNDLTVTLGLEFTL